MSLTTTRRDNVVSATRNTDVPTQQLVNNNSMNYKALAKPLISGGLNSVLQEKGVKLPNGTDVKNMLKVGNTDMWLQVLISYFSTQLAAKTNANLPANILNMIPPQLLQPGSVGVLYSLVKSAMSGKVEGQKFIARAIKSAVAELGAQKISEAAKLS